MKQIIVDGYETNYYITENGDCYNSKTGKYLKGQISNSGYLNYNLSLTSENKKRYYAHRLVALMFLDNPQNLPEVNHKDGNKLNNNITNLEWVTSKENIQHSLLLNLNPNHKKVYQFNKELQLVKIYSSMAEADRAGYTASMVQQELSNKNKTLTLNYYWNDNEKIDFQIITTQNTGKSTQVQQLDLQNNIIAIYNSMGQAAKAIGGSHSHISECCRGKIKTYKGYKWQKV